MCRITFWNGLSSPNVALPNRHRTSTGMGATLLPFHYFKELVSLISFKLNQVRATIRSNSDCGILHLPPTLVAKGSCPLESIRKSFLSLTCKYSSACFRVRNFSGVFSFGLLSSLSLSSESSNLISFNIRRSIFESLSVIIIIDFDSYSASCWINPFGYSVRMPPSVKVCTHRVDATQVGFINILKPSVCSNRKIL